MKVRMTMRGNTPEIFLGDPDGLIIQLQDRAMPVEQAGWRQPSAVEPSPKKGLLAVKPT